MAVARSCLVPFGGQPRSTGFILPPFFPPTAVQGSLLLLVTELVHGGCLQAALQQPDQRRQLAWAARCAGGASGACGRGRQTIPPGATCHLLITQALPCIWGASVLPA